MKKLADFIVEKRKLVLAVFIVISVISVVMSRFVTLNYDMTTYLPDDSSAKQGVSIMNDEFVETTSLSVMAQDLTDDQKTTIQSEIEAIDGVDSVTYDTDSEEYNKDGYSLFTVNIAGQSYSKKAASVLKEVKQCMENNLNGAEAYYAGDVVDSQDSGMGQITTIAVILLIIILFIMSESFLEPILMLVAIGMAVLISMGTNLLFPSVSNMTHSIAAILQLALSMDYSIMLMDRYHQEKSKQIGKVQAMKNAISLGFASIVSSSVTTIVGLLCLIFMSFTIGRDMGLVLAKSVLISLICILFVLSSLLVLFDEQVAKTKKKAPVFQMKLLSRFSYRFRYVILPLFLVIFAGSYALKDQLGITYAFETSNEDQKKIESVFPAYNSVVLLYNNDDESKTSDLTDYLLEKYPDQIESISSYGDTIGKEYTSDELADTFGMDASMMRMLFYNYYNSTQDGKMTISQFLDFLCDDVVTNETFANELDPDMAAQLEQLRNYANADAINQQRSPAQIAELLGMQESDIKSLFLLYYNNHGGVATGTMTLAQFVELIQNDIMTDPTYTSMIDESVQGQLGMLASFTDENVLSTAISASDMAALIGMDADMTSQIYFAYYMNHGLVDMGTMSINEFVTFIQTDVLTNPGYASLFDDQTTKQIQTLSIFTNVDTITAQYSAQQIAQMLGMDSSLTGQLFQMHSMITQSNTETMSLPEFVEFVTGTVAVMPEYASYFDATTLAQLGQTQQLMQLALSGQQLDVTQMAQMLGMDTATLQNLYLYHVMLYGDTSSYQMTPQNFVAYLVNELATSSEYSGMIDDTSMSQLQLLNTVINSTLSHQEYTPSELGTLTGMDDDTMNMLYLYRKNVNGDTADWKMSLNEFVTFLVDEVAQNTEYQSMFDADTLSQLKMMQTVMNAVLTDETYTTEQMTELISGFSDQLSDHMISMLYLLYFSEHESDADWTFSLYDFATYMVEQVASDPLFADYLDQDTLSGLESAQETMENGKSQLVGEHHARLIISTNYDADCPEVYAFLQDMQNQCSDLLSQDYYIVGNSMINYETRQSFESELNFINLLTIIAIFLVIVVTFRSISIPVILVAMIQGAIYLVMGINYIQGIGIYYLALVIVQSILMGAAIDYSILYTTYYTKLRREWDVKTAIQKAYKGSMSTILTSSSILIGITFIVGMTSSNQSTGEICLTLSKGALIALLQVVFLLPGVLSSLDRFVVGRRGVEFQENNMSINGMQENE